MSLSEIIINKIKTHGPISFYEFMNYCLYHTELGYYTSGVNIGKKGDFYTNSNVSSVFGEMLAKKIEEIWKELNINKFTVIEVGAGNGLLSRDIIESLKKNKELYTTLNYCIIEKSTQMIKQQKKILKDGVKWYNSLDEISEINGCIFSNELIDAFPVHIVVMKQELMEVFVDYKDGFLETLKPASYELKNYFDELGVTLKKGFRTEVNLDAIKYIEQVSSCLKKGYLITIDYGYFSDELYSEYRKNGTLMCYYKHTSNDNPYLNIGKQDITSHVNFSALIKYGEKNSLRLCDFTDQLHFLYNLGIEKYLKDLYENNPEKYHKVILKVKNLLFGIGKAFKVLIQKKYI